MADSEIREYTSTFFNESIRAINGVKQTRIDAKPGHLRVYRDMADPSTLVIEDTVRKLKIEVAWGHVTTAKRKPVEAKAEQPQMQTQSQQGQQHQGKGR